jgi:PAS domain S-box-containing protein
LAGAEEPALPKAAASFQKPFEDPEVQHGIRLQAVLDTAVDGIILMDSSGSIMTFNPACERLFGYRPEEVIGRNVKMLMPPVYSDNHDQYLKNYQRTHDPKIIGIGREVLAQRKNESIFPIYLSVGEAKQGSESLFVGIISDLSARRETEERLRRSQRMESIGQLTGGIAHDFNNILTVITSSAEMLLLDLEPGSEMRMDAQTIHDASTRGAQLTRQILSFAKGRELHREPLDLNGVVAHTVAMLSRLMGANVTLVQQPDSSGAMIFGDRGQVEQILVNLILNARDAVEAEGTVTVATQRLLDDSVALMVSDDGMGIPEGNRDKIFEAFFTTKPAGQGTGLGLSTVNALVRCHGATITVTSRVGVGTTFEIVFPVTAITEPREVL